VRQPGGVGFSTQDECRLTCGQWGALWPRPTGGAFVYSTELVPLDTTRVNFASVPDPLLVQMQSLFLKEINLVACGQPRCSPCDASVQCQPLIVELSILDLSIQSLEWSTDESYSLQASLKIMYNILT
jgi:hexosaminidase